MLTNFVNATNDVDVKLSNHKYQYHHHSIITILYVENKHICTGVRRKLLHLLLGDVTVILLTTTIIVPWMSTQWQLGCCCQRSV